MKTVYGLGVVILVLLSAGKCHAQSGSFSPQGLGANPPSRLERAADRETMEAVKASEQRARDRAAKKKADEEKAFQTLIDNATPAQKKRIDDIVANYEPKIATMKEQLDKMESQKKAAIVKVLAK